MVNGAWYRCEYAVLYSTALGSYVLCVWFGSVIYVLPYTLLPAKLCFHTHVSHVALLPLPTCAWHVFLPYLHNPYFWSLLYSSIIAHYACTIVLGLLCLVLIVNLRAHL